MLRLCNFLGINSTPLAAQFFFVGRVLPKGFLYPLGKTRPTKSHLLNPSQLAAGCFVLTLLLLTGCASTSKVTLQSRPASPETSAYAFNGRVVTKHDGERSSAGVRWTHKGVEDEILLLAPLGQTVARIYSDAQGVLLETSGKKYFEQDAETLTERVLGWHLPLSGMRYWVLALPAAGGGADVERAENGQIKVLRQDGWEINYTRYAAESADSLPLRMTLQRNGMEMLLLIDEWEI